MIFPSIYIPHNLDGKLDEAKATWSTVGEAVRCGKAAGLADGSRARPVLPYGWDHFHSLRGLRSCPPRVVAQLEQSDASAAGVVMWGRQVVKNASYTGG